MKSLSELNLSGLRDTLVSKRQRMEQLVADHLEDSQPVELDQTRVGRLSRMDALQGQAMAKERERRRQVNLKRIEAALQRLDEGDYGYCVICGEEIAPKRLELDPTSATCINCARKSEKH